MMHFSRDDPFGNHFSLGKTRRVSVLLSISGFFDLFRLVVNFSSRASLQVHSTVAVTALVDCAVSNLSPSANVVQKRRFFSPGITVSSFSKKKTTPPHHYHHYHHTQGYRANPQPCSAKRPAPPVIELLLRNQFQENQHFDLLQRCFSKSHDVRRFVFFFTKRYFQAQVSDEGSTCSGRRVSKARNSIPKKPHNHILSSHSPSNPWTSKELSFTHPFRELQKLT